MSGGPRTETSGSSTQNRDPWAPAIPGLTNMLGGITSWMNDPNSKATYGGQTLAGQSDTTRNALGLLADNKGYDASQKYLSGVLSGDHVNASNPYIEGMKQSAIDSAMPGINATFGRSGMTGSTQHQGMLAQGLGAAVAPIAGQAYMNERNMQQQSAMALPAMGRQQAMDKLMSGGLQEQYSQAGLDDARGRWERERMSGLQPYMQAFPMMAGIAGLGGSMQGTNQSTQQTFTPPWQTALGLGMAGASIFSGMPPGMFGGMLGGQQQSANPFGMGFASPWQRA